jgi:hypothetical protein
VQSFGRFTVVRRLGSGGTGTVWLAEDRETKRLVALKVLAPEWLRDPEAIAALEREYAAIRALDHPNILRVEGLFRTASDVWIAMEYAPGGNLSQLRGQPYAAVLRAAIPVASALAHAHAAGLVHRDVKPANVLLASDGSVRLADFGTAVRLAQNADGALAMRGSPFSMSPQQLDGEPANASDDVYAFGVTLYELLSGYPPFYPDADAERIRSEKPAPLPASVPPKLAHLIDRMLAKTPAQRPETMAIVERELKAAAMTQDKSAVETAAVRIEPPSLRGPGLQGEPLRSEWKRSGAANVSDHDLRKQGFRRGLGVSGIVLGMIGLLGVFFALPRWVEDQQQVASYRPAASTKPAPAVEQEKKEVDFAALARAKQEAEDLRAALDSRLQKLREQAVDVWGGSEIQRTDEELAAASKDFEAREYASAVAHIKNVEPLITTLENRSGEVLKAQLQAGALALNEGRSADAKTAFELAAKIDPKNETAARGLKRAGTLDQVLDLVAAAERLDKEGQAQGALDQYRKALVLDAEAPRAAEAIARIEARLAGDAFASAMARGFSALAGADHATARSAFEAAGRIRPNAPEVTQALRQIEQEQRTGIIGTKLRAAEALEAQEQWAEALKEYQAVLQLDSTVTAANQGVARVSPRATLNEQLELYLTQPERLFSQSVRAAARDSLTRARAIANPGPVLQRQMSTLDDWLTRANIPVSVAIQSDNLTQVTIYRIGSLGTFEQRSLELVPGSYTVVGTRPGYRDVRRRIDVIPGAPLEPIVIRCEDKI